MAALLCMGSSTFRDYVKRGLLPEGVMIGNLRRWKVAAVLDVLDALRQNSDVDDPYLKALRGPSDGQKPSGRRHDA